VPPPAKPSANSAKRILRYFATYELILLFSSIPYAYSAWCGTEPIFYGILPLLASISLCGVYCALWSIHAKGVWRFAVTLVVPACALTTFLTYSVIDGIRIDLLQRSKANATPLFAAIERYRFDHGFPPETLTKLVPRYISKIPRSAYFRQPPFRYSTSSFGDEPWWYLTGDTGSMLALQLDKTQRVTRIRVIDAPKVITHLKFSTLRWRSERDIRSLMVQDLLRRNKLKGQTFPAIVQLLGPPDYLGWDLALPHGNGYYEPSLENPPGSWTMYDSYSNRD
jgi:hypothetical protein